MKRKVMILSAIAVVLVIGMVLAGTALAQGPVGDEDGVRASIGGAYGPAHGFVDADGDGVNDRSLTGDCDGTGIGTGTGSTHRFAQGSQGQAGHYGQMSQSRTQLQDCDGDCTQDGTGDQLQTRDHTGNPAGKGGR